MHTYDKKSTYPLLVLVNLVIGDGVGLGNDGNKVDLVMKLLHHLNVQGLQRMASGLDEVDNSVNAVVDNVHAVDLVLGVQVRIESLLNVLDDRIPRLIIVDEVTEARGVNHGQPQTDTVLLDVGADGLYRNGLGNVEARGLALLGRVQ